MKSSKNRYAEAPANTPAKIAKRASWLFVTCCFVVAIAARRLNSENHARHIPITAGAIPAMSNAGENSLNGLAQRGYATIPAVRLARLIVCGRDARVTAPSAAISIAIMAGWPVLINFILYFIWPSQSLRGFDAIILISVSAIIVATMLTAARGAWSIFARYAAVLDEFLMRSPDRVRILNWFSKRLSPSLQIFALGFTGIMAGLILTFHAKNVAPLDIEVRVCSYIMSALMGFIGVNVVYWLYTMAELTLRLSRCRDLRLDWFDPARTPAIRTLCKAYAFTAPALVIGVVAVEILALLIPSEGDLILEGLALGFPVFAAITALYVCLQPYLTLYLLVKRYKTTILAQMASEIRKLESTLEDVALQAKLEAYRHIASAPNLVISTTSVVQYSAAIGGSLVAFFLQKFLA